jgi:hypothetical protein
MSIIKTLAPDAILAITSMAGSVTDIDESPDAPDNNWVACSTGATSGNFRVSFPTPGQLVVGAGLQTFRAYVRNQDTAHARNFTLAVYENSVSKASSSNISVAAGVSEIISFTWNANLLSDITGAGVECYITVANTSGFANGVGALEWDADIVTVDLTAAGITVASPAIGTPALRPTIPLAATWTGKSPVIGSPDFGQVHRL